MPVAGSFRRASAFDGEHDNYAGEIGLSANPKLKARIENADVVLLVGGRMSEAAAQGYTLFDIPAPRQRLVHVHADPLEIGRNYHPDARHRRHLAGILRRARRRSAAVDDPRGRPETRRRAPTISPGASRRRPIRAGCR